MRNSDKVRGAWAMIAAMALFVLNNTVMKLATGNMPVSEAVMIRGLLSALLILVVMRARRQLHFLRLMTSPLVLLRAAFDSINAVAFLTALTLMSLADDVSIQQTVPLLMTAYAALVLRERVSWRKWIAVGAGLTGALLIANPTGSHPIGGTAMAFCAALAVTGRDITTRHIDKSVPLLLVTLCAALVLTLAAAALALTDVWTIPRHEDLWLLGAAAALITLALVTIGEAFRRAPVHTLAPFYYAQTVFAVFATYVFFGVSPRALSVVGMALVVATGLYVSRVEPAVDQKRRTARQARSLSA
jgi:drug/metabolite transporter (DMT)-like permease